MDAAQLFRKFALFLVGALLLAGAANAANIVVDKDTITFSVGVQQQQVNVSMDDSSTQAITITNNSGWFTVSTSSGATPATLTVTKTGDCTISVSGCNTKFTIGAGSATKDITVNNSTSPGGGGTSGILTSNQATVPMSAVFPNTAVATVVISSSSSVSTSLSASVTQGNNWLVIQSQSSAAIVAGSPVTLILYAYSSGLANNQSYDGQITLTPGNGSAALTIPVRFSVGTTATTGSLTPSQTPIAFSYPGGNLATVIGVSSPTTTTYTATASSSGWLQVNSLSSTTLTTNSGNNLYISANLAVVQFMTTGTYQGYVTLTNSFSSSDVTTIPITLYVNGGGGGTSTGGVAGPSSLTFNYQVGRGAPPYQEIIIPGNGVYTITTTGTPLSVSTSSLTVSGGTPGSILVLPAVAGLNPGTYSGTVAINSNTGFYQTVSVTVNVTSSAVLQAYVNGATGDYTCSTVSGCNAATVTVRASDDSAQTMTVTSSQAWVTIENASTATPGNFLLRVNTSGLSAGMNNATVTVTGSGATNAVIPVAVQVGTGGGGGSGSGSLTISASSLTFNAVNVPQTLSISSSTSTTASVSVGCNWVTVSPSGNVTVPQSLSITVNSAVASGSQCTVTLQGNNSSNQTVTVTYNPSGSGSSGNINVDKTTISFATTVGTNPATQTIAVTGANGASSVGFTVGVESSSGWLSASPTSGSTPGTVTVSANVAGLSTGVHAGIVRITGNNGNQYAVQVALTITAATTVSATPATLSFSYVAGSANPAAQQIQVTGTGSNLSYSATVASGADWLSVTPASGTAPATLQAAVSPGSLNPGNYTGTITVAGAGGATGSTTITVNLTVTAPLPTIARVTNAASFNTGSLAAGEIVSLFGTGMGPATGQQAGPDQAGKYPTTLGGVTVTIGGYPAPLTYVSNGQINAIVPYEVNRPFLANLTVLVRYLGQSSNGVTLPQVGAAPGIFTTGSGTGQGLILNSNLSQNLSGNPATKGDVIVLYVTGEGVTSPAGVTGRITPTVQPFPQPVSGNVTVTIDGIPATVQFYGEAPGLVAAVMQVNVVVPQGVSSGSVPVVVRVGDAASQLTANNIGAVTVAVR